MAYPPWVRRLEENEDYFKRRLEHLEEKPPNREDFVSGNDSCNASRKSLLNEHDNTSAGQWSNNDNNGLTPDNDTQGDPQSTFYAIKDAVNHYKLPPDHKLNEQKRGIKRKDQQTLQVLSRSARYVETTFKLLGPIPPEKGISQQDYAHLLPHEISPG